MSNMAVIVSEMALCLLAALAIGALFGYLFSRAKNREHYENKIDALEELCESKRQESEYLKENYGKLEIEKNRLVEENEHCEELLVKCRENEEQLLTQLDMLVQENESLTQKLKQYQENSQNGEPDRELLQKLSDIKAALSNSAAEISDTLKKEVHEEIEKVEKALSGGEKKQNILSYLNTLLGKVKQRKE